MSPSTSTHALERHVADLIQNCLQEAATLARSTPGSLDFCAFPGQHARANSRERQPDTYQMHALISQVVAYGADAVATLSSLVDPRADRYSDNHIVRQIAYLCAREIGAAGLPVLELGLQDPWNNAPTDVLNCTSLSELSARFIQDLCDQGVPVSASTKRLLYVHGPSHVIASACTCEDLVARLGAARDNLPEILSALQVKAHLEPTSLAASLEQVLALPEFSKFCRGDFTPQDRRLIAISSAVSRIVYSLGEHAWPAVPQIMQTLDSMRNKPRHELLKVPQVAEAVGYLIEAIGNLGEQGSRAVAALERFAEQKAVQQHAPELVVKAQRSAFRANPYPTLPWIGDQLSELLSTGLRTTADQSAFREHLSAIASLQQRGVPALDFLPALFERSVQQQNEFAASQIAGVMVALGKQAEPWLWKLLARLGTERQATEYLEGVFRSLLQHSPEETTVRAPSFWSGVLSFVEHTSDLRWLSESFVGDLQDRLLKDSHIAKESAYSAFIAAATSFLQRHGHLKGGEEPLSPKQRQVVSLIHHLGTALPGAEAREVAENALSLLRPTAESGGELSKAKLPPVKRKTATTRRPNLLD